MKRRWKEYLPGDTVESASVHILQVLSRGKQDETIYRVRCLTCSETSLMSHATIMGRKRKRQMRCTICRAEDGLKNGIRPNYSNEEEIVPPTWPAPKMLAHLPRGWNR